MLSNAFCDTLKSYQNIKNLQFCRNLEISVTTKVANSKLKFQVNLLFKQWETPHFADQIFFQIFWLNFLFDARDKRKTESQHKFMSNFTKMFCEGFFEYECQWFNSNWNFRFIIQTMSNTQFCAVQFFFKFFDRIFIWSFNSKSKFQVYYSNYEE